MNNNPEIKISISTTGADKAKSEIQDLSRSSGTSMSTIAGGAFIAQVAFSALQTTVGFVTDTFVSLSQQALNQSASLEQYAIGFKTLTGNATDANNILNQLKKDASETPFQLPELAQATQMLMGAGDSADEARKQMMDLGDAISATGGGSDAFARMSYNLAQVKSVGHATAIDIRQFAMSNIPIYDLLAQSMGKSKEEIQAMDASKFTFEEITKALDLANNSGNRFFNGMKNQSETFNGRMTTLKDNFGNMLSELFNDSGGFGLAKDVLEFIINEINIVKPDLDAFATQFGSAMSGIFGALQDNDQLKQLGKDIREVFTKEVKEDAQKFIDSLEKLGVWIQSDNGKIAISEFSADVRDFGDAIGSIKKTIESLIPSFQALVDLWHSVDVISKNPLVQVAFNPAGAIGGGINSIQDKTGIDFSPVNLLTGGLGIPHKADGGIIGGSNYSGDRVPIMANSGELVINQHDQSSLFSFIKGLSNVTNKSVNFNGPVTMGGSRNDTQNQTNLAYLLKMAI